MDIHNYRVYAPLSFHMSQLIHIKKYLFEIWLCISDHLVRIVFKEKSQMKSGGGLLFTAWLLLMAWCLFSNRVSTATVVGNGYLQVVTCKYLIFCSLDKYKLSVPRQVCAFAQKRLIELKSTLVGGARGLISFRPRSAELPLLLSHGCPIIGRAAPMHFYTNCSDWAQIWWENPDGTARACPGGPASPDQSVHPCSYPFRQKRGFFSMGNANSRNQEKGVVFIFNFGKLNSHSLITQGDDMTYIHK